MRTQEILAPLPDGWAVARCFCLRSAGFAADRVLTLALRGLDRPLGLAAARESAEQRARQAAHAACSEALRSAEEEGRRELRRLRRRLRAGKLPATPAAGGETLAAALAELRRAGQARQRAVRHLERHVERQRSELAMALRRQARDEHFREALVWQNHGALDSSVDALLRRPSGASDSQTRRQEQLVASYLQRYCVKNDTIGFFGPVGWGRFVTTGPTLELQLGPQLLARRTVYFEHWAIDALAARLARDPALRPWLAPRRLPIVQLSGDRLCYPDGRSVRLPAWQARLLAACDGQRSARQLAAEAAAGGEPAGEARIFEFLAGLERRRLITWTLEVPTEIWDPAEHLRQLLLRIADPALRQATLAVVDELSEHRRAVAQAAGDAAALSHAMSALETTFSHHSGRQPMRRGGLAYAGRSVVYEDCRRDLELRLGPEILHRFGPALSLVLHSARWLTHSLARRYRSELTASYAALRREDRHQPVEFLRFWQHAASLLSEPGGGTPRVVRQVTAELAARWSRILGIGEQQGPIELRSADLESAVEEAFSAAGPGWPMARFHSPDLHLAAADAAAIRRGELVAVLGEVHAGVNGHLLPMFLCQHPNPDELLSFRELFLPTGSIAPVTGKQRFHRAEYFSLYPGDFHLTIRETPSWRPPKQVMSIGELVVEEQDGRLVVRTRDRRLCFDIIAFLERFLIGSSLDAFRLAPPRAHTPRVSIDDLIVCRECWHFAPEEVTFPRLGTPDERFLAAIRWARQKRLPRFAFYKVPEEPKPIYLDFHSPIYVEIFARTLRRASAVQLSEMLPAHHQLWLRDREQRSYTSELRLVAVDPIPWCAPSAGGPEDG